MISSFQKKLVDFSYSLPNAILKLLVRLLYKAPPYNLQKIIVVHNATIGDAICTLPILAAIKNHYKSASIIIASSRGNDNNVGLKEIASSSLYNSFFDFTISGYPSLFKFIKVEKPDLVIYLPPYTSSFLFELWFLFQVKGAKVRSAFGWRVSSHTLFPKWQSKHKVFDYEAIRLQKILLENEIQIESNISPSSNLFCTDYETIESKLIPQKPFVTIILGSKKPANRWNIEVLISTINYISSNKYQVVLLGGADSIEMSQKVIEQLKGFEIHSFCGKLSILQNKDLLEKSSLILSVDTGLMHMAYLLNLPLIAVFSSRDYEGKWYPPKNNNTIIVKNGKDYCKNCFNMDTNFCSCSPINLENELKTAINKQLKKA